jgi:hypothetical protein
MQLSTGTLCVLLIAVAACAAPSPPPAAQGAPSRPAPKFVEHGTILAIHPVPAEDPRTARILLARLGDATPADGHSVEYILRDQDGTTISVVQADVDGLQPGDRVSIRRGARTRISNIAASADSDYPVVGK